MATLKERNSGLTRHRLKQLLAYNPVSGEFLWLVDRGYTARAGTVAGWIDGCGYRKITVDMVDYSAHRLAVFYMTGAWPENDVDHKNLNRGDNRWKNLRNATRSQNRANTKVRSDNVSRLRGVTKRRAGFDARIMVKGKAHHLGCFKTAAEAHAAYKTAAQNFYGEFHRV